MAPYEAADLVEVVVVEAGRAVPVDVGAPGRDDAEVDRRAGAGVLRVVRVRDEREERERVLEQHLRLLLHYLPLARAATRRRDPAGVHVLRAVIVRPVTQRLPLLRDRVAQLRALRNAVPVLLRQQLPLPHRALRRRQPVELRELELAAREVLEDRNGRRLGLVGIADVAPADDEPGLADVVALRARESRDVAVQLADDEVEALVRREEELPDRRLLRQVPLEPVAAARGRLGHLPRERPRRDRVRRQHRRLVDEIVVGEPERVLRIGEERVDERRVVVLLEHGPGAARRDVQVGLLARPPVPRRHEEPVV